MSETPEMGRAENARKLGDEVEMLADQVKMVALNLAINLAKAKNSARELAFMEGEFTTLINGTIEVIKKVSVLARAFRNDEKMIYTPPNDGERDQIESSLDDILDLSRSIIETINAIKEKRGKVDRYKRQYPQK